MMKIRARFEKLEGLKYISHLELMTLFRRAFKRAGIPLSYSNGFNPHVLLSLGPPLKVGMTGRNEYFDLELSAEIRIENFITLVNRELPEGLRILGAISIPENTKPLMSVINTAVYVFDMILSSNIQREEEMLSEFLAENSIIITRQRRNKKDIEIDIRPLIFSGELIEPDKWEFQVKCSSQGNLRVEEISKALSDYFKEVEFVPVINVEREGLYIKNGTDLYNPFDDIVIRELR